MRFRKKPDGRLLAPHRGGPPVCPDGYERDPQDKYICLPIIKPCSYREKKKKCTGCGGGVEMHCRYAYKRVNWRICAECEANPEVYYGLPRKK